MTVRALITGGCGFIGSHLTNCLIEKGWYIDVVDNLSSGRRQNLTDFGIKIIDSNNPSLFSGKSVRLFETSYDDDIVLDLVSGGVYDYVFHLGAIPRVSYSMEEPWETTDNNLNKSLKLLDACVGNVKRFVFSSSSSVYGGAESLPTDEFSPHSPKSPYALQKSAMEQFVKLYSEIYDIDCVSLRYFNVFGPGQMGDSPYSTAVAAWCNAIKEGLPLRSDGDGTQSRDLCYIDNVVEANWLAATCENDLNGAAYNVACGDRTSNNEILEYLTEKFPYIVVNHAPWRPGDVMHTQANIDKIQRDLGYSVKVRFWEGLKLTIDWWGLDQ
jgi:nucleoside-diphosphate-sugar epimerase